MSDFEHSFANELASAHLADGGDYWRRLCARRRYLRLALGGLLLAAILVTGLLYRGQQPAAALTVGGDNLPLRLHIVANSDNAADQALKLQVRDAVVAYLTPLLAEVETAGEAREIVLAQLPQLEALAAGLTADFGYGAYAELGRFDFPAKRYGQVFMPAGEYPALRLVLGEGAGHNWWCVLFPPLCFVDECGEFQVSGAEAGAGLLVSQQGERQVRLKICEIFYKN